MKITGIEIGEYRQFKNIKFDFTYPEGHPKAGQPLEKVCFIGQSGTGKTTILRIISNFFSVLDYSCKESYDKYLPSELLNIAINSPAKATIDVFIENTIRKNINWEIPNEILHIDWYEKIKSHLSKWLKKSNLEFIKHENKILCIYIDDSIIEHSEALTRITVNADSQSKPLIATSEELKESDNNTKNNPLDENKVHDIRKIDPSIFWSYLLQDIREYEQGLLSLVNSIVTRRSNFSSTHLIKKIDDWQNSRPNPKVDLIDKCLNPILGKFFLEVDTDDARALIALRTKRGKKLYYPGMSSGTRQILATAIPIYKFDTKDTVILFDEPERSLFPDIQSGLINYYTSLAPEAQFFFATHSPIIAASFEPCERFILYFNEEGEVQVRNGVAPIGDDPNDILRQDFGMSPLMQEEGINAYQRYLSLATEIKNESDINRKMELLGERAELGNRYNFPAFNETN